MTLDALAIVISADIGGAQRALSSLSELCAASGARVDALQGAFSAAGANAGGALAAGILSRRGAVLSAAFEVAQAAARALREALDIRSPSRVTSDIGRMFDRGLAQGIAQSGAEVARAADALGQTASDGLSRTVPSVSAALDKAPPLPLSGAPQSAQSIRLTVPVMLDGRQIALAAVENINELTRTGGRCPIHI